LKMHWGSWDENELNDEARKDAETASKVILGP
jgi:hypothetical protein